MINPAHKPTLLDAVERLAARDAGGDESQHGLESETERLLGEAETEQVAEQHGLERLYRSAATAGGPGWRLLRAALVLAAVGAALALLAWWLGGFGI
jgi:hypothetical protein